jgi:hypothetical protein
VCVCEARAKGSGVVCYFGSTGGGKLKLGRGNGGVGSSRKKEKKNALEKQTKKGSGVWG